LSEFGLEWLQDSPVRCRKFLLLLGCLIVGNACAQTNTNLITREAVVQAQQLIGLDFSEQKIDLMLPGLKGQLEYYEVMRRFPLSNSVPLAM